jgi:hypothetical protein
MRVDGFSLQLLSLLCAQANGIAPILKNQELFIATSGGSSFLECWG